MKARRALLVLSALILGAIGLGNAASSQPSRPAADQGAVGQEEVFDTSAAIVCSREDPCGPGFVCRGGKCVPKK